MRQQLTVSSHTLAAETGSLGPVIASLPVSLAATENSGDLRAVAGAPGWAARAIAEIADGAQGVLVVHPILEDSDELRQRSLNRGVPVVLDHEWSSNPTVSAARLQAASIRDRVAMIDAIATIDPDFPLDGASQRLVFLIEQIAGPIVAPRILVWSENIMVVGATLAESDAPVVATVVVGPPTVLPVRIWLAHDSGHIDVRLPSATTSRPGQLIVTDAVGSTLSPTQYENSHRASWRRLIAAVRAKQATTDLEDFQQQPPLL